MSKIVETNEKIAENVVEGYKKIEDTAQNNKTHTTVRMKRDRKIINKVELTRLQNHFEARLNEIDALEESKSRRTTAVSLIVGTAFMSGDRILVTMVYNSQEKQF